MPGRSSGLLAKQPIVVGMTANPKPDQAVRCFHREGAIVSADTGRPEPADFLEVKGGVPWILLQACVRLIGEIANLLRQRLVQRPKVRGSVMGQSGVVLPAAWSRSALAARSSRRPASASRSIWRSQIAQSYSKNQARNCANSSGESAWISCSIFSILLIAVSRCPQSSIHLWTGENRFPAG
jgi:hypothetical protein